MKILKKLIFNGIILTSSSLLLRWIGVVFNSFITNKLGSEGMGIYSLVQSVFGFAITFSCSGINLGTTRLVSEALANNYWGDAKKSLKKCIIYSLFFSVIAFLLLYLCADFIGKSFLGDYRTIKSIRVLSASLPFISLSSVFNGYFSAVRRAYKNATSLILEQLVHIFITVRLLSPFTTKDIESACLAVAVGIVVSEIISLIYNIILCYLDFKKNKTNSIQTSVKLTKKLVKISLPLALSAYIRSGLVTIEHILIPYGLRKNGASYSKSMSMYGIVQGMVFPIIMFPSCVIYSFSSLLVPELASFNEKKEHERINRTISRVIRYSLYFSIGVAGIIMCYAYELSMVFYNSAEAYEYIRLFAPLVTVMYLDGAVDGILKGLNEQLYSMKINIADAVMSVFLVYILVPRFGVKGYIIAIFVCEIFNCTMSLMRLVKIAQPQISITNFIIKPIFFSIVSIGIIVYVFIFFKITYLGSKINVIIRISCTLLLYIMLFFYSKENRKQIFSYKKTINE